MAAVLSSDMDKTDKVVTFIDECRALKIDVVPPNVNRCFHKFVARDNSILFGLGAIKGVGEHVINTVVNERETNGPFTDIFELCRRLPLGTLNKKSFEAMTYSGALDDLGPSRSAIYDALPEAIKLADQYHKDENSGQGGLFGDEIIAAVASPSLSADIPEWPSKEKLDKEKNALGLFISGHPINDYQTILEKITLSKLGDLTTLLDDEGQKNKLRYDKRSVTLAGYIMNAFSRPTKRGGNMTIFQIDDRTGQTELRLFDEELAALSFEIETGKVVIIEAEMDYDSYRQDLRYKIKNILTVEDAQAKFCRAIRIALNGRTNPESIQKIRMVLERYQGGHAGVLLQYHRENAIAQFRLGRDWVINPTPDCLAELNAIVDEQQLTISYRTNLS
jgi:DNA polymerase-3 subunit alpha